MSSYAWHVTVISGRLPARPITRTGRLLHTAKKKSTDYPHRWITRTLLFNFFGGENVTLRRYISVFRFRHVHNSVSILAYTLLIKLYSENWTVKLYRASVKNLNDKVSSVQNPLKSSSSVSLLNKSINCASSTGSRIAVDVICSSSLMSDVWDASSSVPLAIPAFLKPFLMDETFTAFQARN